MKNWCFGKINRINRPQERLTWLKRKHTRLDIKNNVVYHYRGFITHKAPATIDKELQATNHCFVKESSSFSGMSP